MSHKNNSSKKKETVCLEIVILLILAYGLSLGFRLIELPAWQSDAFRIAGEYSLPTSDPYTWIVRAQAFSNNVLSSIIFIFREYINVQPANAAFWLPVFFASLGVIPIIVLGFAEKQAPASLPAAVLATASIAYIERTRLGWFDYEMLTMFFYLAEACALYIWLDKICINRILKRKEISGPDDNHLVFYLMSFLVGGIVYLGNLLIANRIYIFAVMLLLALVVGFLFAVKGKRKILILGFALAVAVAFGDWPGMVGSLGFIAVYRFKPKLVENWFIIALFGFAVCLFFGYTGMIDSWLDRISTLIRTYTGKKAGFSPQKSTEELQNLDFFTMAKAIAGHWLIFIAGVLGYLYLVWKRPLFLIFSLFLGLGVSSIFLGKRLSMFGGPAIGVGLGFGLHYLLMQFNWFRQKNIFCWIAQLALCVIICWPIYSKARDFKPVPLLPKKYVQGYIKLKHIGSNDSLVWDWWDYGTLIRYYTQKVEFCNPANKKANWHLHLAGEAYASQSQLKANQIIKYNKRIRRWDREKMETLAHKKINKKPTHPEHYFTVSWRNMIHATWISYYGNWDPKKKKSSPGRVQQVSGKLRIDSKKGFMKIRDEIIPLKKLVELSEKGTKMMSWEHRARAYCLYNRENRQCFLVDKKIFDSMMIQMLVYPPQKFEEHFELVVDNYPWNRIYRVR